MVHPRTKSALVLAVAAILWSRAASADQVHYVGIHPIAASDAHALCYIEVPHVHIYKPEQAKVLYRVHDDTYHFVGDPVAFGYDGDKHSYYGHHPIRVHVDVDVDIDVHLVPDGFDDDYCYLDGPHFHAYEPLPGAKFEFKGDAYWYVGKYSPRYRKHRKRLVQVNAVYEPLEYERPVVVVEARPPAYRGPVIGVDVRSPDVGVEVRGPDVEVRVPAPSVQVDVDLGVSVPGVLVIEKDRRHRRHKKHKRYRKHKKHKKFKKFKKGRR